MFKTATFTAQIAVKNMDFIFHCKSQLFRLALTSCSTLRKQPFTFILAELEEEADLASLVFFLPLLPCVIKRTLGVLLQGDGMQLMSIMAALPPSSATIGEALA